METYVVGEKITGQTLMQLQRAGSEQAFLSLPDKTVFIVMHGWSSSERHAVKRSLTVKALFNVLCLLSFDFSEGEGLSFDVPVPGGELLDGNALTMVFVDSADWKVVHLRMIGLDAEISRIIEQGNEVANTMSTHAWAEQVQALYKNDLKYTHQQVFSR